MSQKKEKSRQSNETSDWQMHSWAEIGSELDFAHIMNTIREGLLVTGKGWRFEYVSSAFAQIFGKSLEDLIGESMDDFIISHDISILAQENSKRLAGETTTYEFRLRRSEGEVVYVHATGVPRRLGNKVVDSISVIANITESRIIERKLGNESNKFKIFFDFLHC